MYEEDERIVVEEKKFYDESKTWINRGKWRRKQIKESKDS
jgi:hypothetical protein